MSNKTQRSNKESKKPSTQTLKEKRVAKKDKKEGKSTMQPLIAPRQG